MTIVKYIIAGLLSYGFYTGLFLLLLRGFHINGTVAVILSYGSAILLNYFINRSYVFKNSRESKVKQGAIYITVGVIGWMTNSVGYYVLVHIFELHYLAVQTSLFLIIGGSTYIINKHWTFRDCFSS
jgi:putative flippase GtrA